MPTYDYICNNCGFLFEVFHKISESPDLICKNCNSSNIQKKISLGSGFILKGSGFYTTDYKRKEEKIPECANASSCNNNCSLTK